ncbi:hypothetical protein Tco_0768443 [Tanacetum coccineum]
MLDDWLKSVYTRTRCYGRCSLSTKATSVSAGGALELKDIYGSYRRTVAARELRCFRATICCLEFARGNLSYVMSYVLFGLQLPGHWLATFYLYVDTLASDALCWFRFLILHRSVHSGLCGFLVDCLVFELNGRASNVGWFGDDVRKVA